MSKLDGVDTQTLIQGILALDSLAQREDEQRAWTWIPYPSQAQIIQSAAKIVGLLGGNQSGKSTTAAYKVSWETMGIYPDWYKGPKSKNPVDVWVVAETSESARDSCQKKLFGPDPSRPGVGGLIPPKYIVGKPTMRNGVPGAFDTVRVRHVSGGVSTIVFKTYAMGREALASWTGNLVWVDEEPPQDCFDELLMRIAARDGQMFITFTPLKGLTKVYKLLTEADSKNVEMAFLGWDQAKHLKEETKEAIKSLYKANPAQLEARMTGRATIATGLIFGQLDFQSIICPHHRMERYFPVIGGLDFGWNHPTAAVAVHKDPDQGACYVSLEYKKNRTTVEEHVRKLLSWGDIDYAFDPSGLQSEKASGEAIIERYLDLMDPGWDRKAPSTRRLFKADNKVWAGIDRLVTMFQNEKLFILDNCVELIGEMFNYHYDENGDIYKKDDDLIDALRYACGDLARARPMGRMRPGDTPTSTPDIKQWRPPGKRTPA